MKTHNTAKEVLAQIMLDTRTLAEVDKVSDITPGMVLHAYRQKGMVPLDGTLLDWDRFDHPLSSEDIPCGCGFGALLAERTNPDDPLTLGVHQGSVSISQLVKNVMTGTTDDPTQSEVAYTRAWFVGFDAAFDESLRRAYAVDWGGNIIPEAGRYAKEDTPWMGSEERTTALEKECFAAYISGAEAGRAAVAYRDMLEEIRLAEQGAEEELS